MADFNEAFLIGILNEGGYCNVSGDTGGETYEGISRNNFPTWQGWVKIDSWKTQNGVPKYNQRLTEVIGLEDDVQEFYKKNFWNRILGDQITSQSIADYFYDWYINSGSHAIKGVQEAINVTVDGDFGNGSLTALNLAGDCLLAIHNERIAFYNRIGIGANAKFLKGWLNRCNDLYNKLNAEENS